MAGETNKPAPWLIAAWPGMGNVAVISAGYLINQLKMKDAGQLDAREYFDISEVEVKAGLVARPRFPRGLFFRWRNPAGRDLIVFIGEAQPSTHTYAYAHELLEKALKLGIERVITFASMASALHPAENPKVTGIATDEKALADLRRAEVEPLADGQIGGLNGVLLGAAMERGISGLCLLAEIPFFAASVPNPKAARAALSVFSVLADIDMSLDELNKYAAAVDKALIEAMEKAQRAADEGEGGAERESGAEDEESPEEEDRAVPESPAAKAPEPKIDFAARQRIEKLFEEARRDPSKGVVLKEELDRLGVFEKYEDRFLDLFRRGG
jgi:predicted ATP-grasp superfamily ATP-dependent carboligase